VTVQSTGGFVVRSSQSTEVAEIRAGDALAARILVFRPGEDGSARYKAELVHQGRSFFVATPRNLWELGSVLRRSSSDGRGANLIEWVIEAVRKKNDPQLAEAFRKYPPREYTQGHFTASWELLEDGKQPPAFSYDVRICYRGKELLRCSESEAKRLVDLCGEARQLVKKYLEQGKRLDDWQRESSPAARAERTLEQMRDRERPEPEERRPTRSPRQANRPREHER
jgi:hypothetical protein